MSGKRMTRRKAIKLAAAASATVAAGSACSASEPPAAQSGAKMDSEATSAHGEREQGAGSVLGFAPLGFQWPVADPFLFCVHHDDHYPAGNAQLGPDPALFAGREMGMDFAGKDGWRMYHGEVVPGFPQHPHRGFETVTIVRRGLLDHSDSLGATARYGRGDVQWLTAGGGIQHAEMFPLIDPSAPNPVELFQIWMNLPAQNKMVPAHFTMLWNELIPKRVVRDADGRATELAVIAGRYADVTAAPPPPNSWAARADSDVAIWTLKLAPHARFLLPAARSGSRRGLYFFVGSELHVGDEKVAPSQRIELRPDTAVSLRNGPDESELLLLQGRPIGEPVAQHGPFVMNTREEIVRAYDDYRRTGFGGWPWPRTDPVHPRDAGRFAKREDGTVERPA
jgi:redox-sensitive bicupin YhaK (pirin superfamily)